jgi:hypothetical protein
MSAKEQVLGNSLRRATRTAISIIPSGFQRLKLRRYIVLVAIGIVELTILIFIVQQI